ncbi:MAG: hypothetical protein FH749_15215 [Firmicutes bacterium]|nr:hypothetical protein [Bacillota bacterium]
MTTYSKDDLTGWEFKIVRSSAKIRGEKFQQLCQEEAENGWELVKKFDDYRVRFKRPVERRQQDGYSEIDPYRTQFGASEAKIVVLVLGITFAFVAIIAFLAIAFS